MQTLEICPYCKSKDSFNILYKNNHNKEEKINFECTSHNFHNYNSGNLPFINVSYAL